MSAPYVGEIRCFGFNFAPVGWAFCNGQTMVIAENTTLFTLIGTTYGGDGVQTFQLPNLQGQVPMHWGTGGGVTTVIGQTLGVPQVTLSSAQMPSHQHTVTAASIPSGGVVDRVATPASTSFLSESQPPNGVYLKAPTNFNAPFSQKAISLNGGSQPHDNTQPYLALNFCISLFGIFPTQN
jgi:microcystin-dependent protein